MIFIQVGFQSIDLGLVSKWFFSSRTVELNLPSCDRQPRKPGSWVSDKTFSAKPMARSRGTSLADKQGNS